MKTRYALILASTLLVPLAHAADTSQPMPPPGMGPGAGMGPGGGPGMDGPAMPDDLKLTADQKQKIQAIHADARKKMQAIQDDTHQQVLKVLTPEQAKKWEERRTQHQEYRQEHMKNRGKRMGPSGGQMMNQPQ